MDLYLVSLATGAVGLGAMAVGGLSHGGHSHGGHGGHDVGHAGHAGHGGHDVHAGHAGHAAHSHGSSAHAAHAQEHGGGGFSWMSLLSPRLLFALMVGFGAGGIAATPLGEPWRFGAGILAAAAFEVLAVGPLWRFFFRFESKPALTLESAVEDDARAVTGFDANGCGLVAVDVDGQIIQLLAQLTPDDRSRGVRVRSGDLVRIAEVDAARGRCTVTTIS
jgi:hypothetical protein